MAYGFCYAQAPGQKTLYLSAAVEMPLQYASDSKHVVANEFAKSLTQTDLRSGTCVTRAGGTTGAEQGRQAFADDARAQGTQVVETGWTFVRTAQTPAPMPTGNH